MCLGKERAERYLGMMEDAYGGRNEYCKRGIDKENISAGPMK